MSSKGVWKRVAISEPGRAPLHISTIHQRRKPWRLIQAAAYRPIPAVPYCPVRCGQEYLGLLLRQGSSAQHTAPSNFKTKDRTQPVRGPEYFLSETNDVRLAEANPRRCCWFSQSQPIPLPACTMFPLASWPSRREMPWAADPASQTWADLVLAWILTAIQNGVFGLPAARGFPLVSSLTQGRLITIKLRMARKQKGSF
ncbi:predicted protein [Histoplasma capsulatum G186AR]|uniref:Uncharacterized protein n=1 Tax=Ajellomyces capsulatus (strain G186AR / H82 / ATCC MYA-2454 / RMSCC 2432) TaxID=447093 RepID=C0NQM9_AJECG|nr:uncharacterized protein HCBG_05309 [Histoplasma capsulatum G186AR]EEH05993.1 predicted protein [Histoplasma capsulatum G186AR]